MPTWNKESLCDLISVPVDYITSHFTWRSCRSSFRAAMLSPEQVDIGKCSSVPIGHKFRDIDEPWLWANHEWCTKHKYVRLLQPMEDGFLKVGTVILSRVAFELRTPPPAPNRLWDSRIVAFQNALFHLAMGSGQGHWSQPYIPVWLTGQRAFFWGIKGPNE